MFQIIDTNYRMRTIHLKRGVDLKLRGQVTDTTPVMVPTSRIAITPDDFPGFIPKAAVKAGDTVEPGSTLMFDKLHPQVSLISPVAGTVEEVVRGERRKIERVIVRVASQGADPVKVDIGDAATDEAALRHAMQRYGIWTAMRQRPYDIVPADTDCRPRDIFVTTFDSAPLAPNLMAGVDMRFVEAGIKALGRLTDGKVYVSVRKGGPTAIEGAEIVMFEGKHPAGNPGVQAANIDPVNKGEIIWTLSITTVNNLGRLLLEKEVPATTDVAVTGPEISSPAIITTYIGAEVAPLLKGRVCDDGVNHRTISGNVLTGYRIDAADGFIRFPYRQITVIAEGDDADEFMGWASPGLSKMSQSRTFLSSLLPGRRFAPDARLHGGRRAMIMSGEYDKVFPMDILPEQLIKAILARDIDRMEQLGIYEVAPEDFAAAEYADPSKLELQKIVREGLDYLRKELE